MLSLVSLSLMTLTEVLENDFLLPLMQEAWCRSWRQCVQALLPHARPPHQAVPLEHLCVGRNSCWTMALSLTHPNHWAAWGPDPVVQQWASFYFPGNSCACCRAGCGSEEQRLLQTPDLVALLISYLLKKMLLLLVCVCLLVCFFHFMKIFHLNFLLFTWSESNWHTEIGQQFSPLFSKAILLDCFLLIRCPRVVNMKSLSLPPFPLESHRLPVHWVGHKFLQAWDFPLFSDWQRPFPGWARDLYNFRIMLNRNFSASSVSWFVRPLLGRSDDDMNLLFDVKKWFAPVIAFRVFLDYINEPIEKEELVKMDEDGWG